MVTILAFLFVFSLVVFVHEYGHFAAARALGVRVETFSIGLGQTLFSWRDRKGTLWRVAAIPLGGYVRFFGDASAVSNPDVRQLSELRAAIEAEHGREAVDACFHFKPTWRRAVVVAAGPAANFVLAFVIFSALALALGERGFEPRVGTVQESSPAAAAGFEPGDRVLAINDRPVRYFADIRRFAALSGGDDARFTVERDGATLDLDVTLGRRMTEDMFGGESSTGYLGVTVAQTPILAAPRPGSAADVAGLHAGDRILAVGGQAIKDYAEVLRIVEVAPEGPLAVVVERDGRTETLSVTIAVSEVERDGAVFEQRSWGAASDWTVDLTERRFGLFGAIAAGAASTYEAMATPVRYVARIITGRESGRELGGILRIGKIAGTVAVEAYDAGASGGGVLSGLGSATVSLIGLAGLLSVSIGLLNLLPIPILDGGHLVYYAYEAVAGRPLGEGAQEWGFRIGLGLVLGLMVFAFWNDLNYLRVFERIGNLFS